MKSTLVRTAAAAAATVLVTVGSMAPAVADHDHGSGSSQDHRAAAGKDEPGATSQGRKDDKAEKGGTGRQGPKQDKSNNGQGEERGNGHTPVTVCHLLGNGSHHLLTVDDNALEAHVNHGDLYPVPAEGCPAATEKTVPGATTPEGDDLPGDVTGDDSTVEDDPAVEDDLAVEDDTTEENGTVVGVDAFDTTSQPRRAQVLGTEAFAGVNRSAPATAPLAGILPQTGAGQLGLAAAAGLVLVGAGAALVARRRAQGA